MPKDLGHDHVADRKICDAFAELSDHAAIFVTLGVDLLRLPVTKVAVQIRAADAGLLRIQYDVTPWRRRALNVTDADALNPVLGNIRSRPKV